MSAKHVAGHSIKSNHRSSRNSDPRSPRWWWNSLTKTVLGLGALASAIGAIMALWPSPDAADSASLTAVGLARMPISEYKERSVSLHPDGGGKPHSAGLHTRN